MKKTCNFCGNRNFRETVVQYIYKRTDRFLIVNDVPCEECCYCGEQYFKADVLKRIERDFESVYSRKKKAQAIIRVPVEQYA
jgi:YgiT-type zinc finger domain-containing protein